MEDFAIWWCSCEGIDFILRYLLVAAVWVTILVLNVRKDSRVVWTGLWLLGFVSLLLAAVPGWLYANKIVDTTGLSGLGAAVRVLIGFIAGLVYLVILAWTIGFTFTKMNRPVEEDKEP